MYSEPVQFSLFDDTSTTHREDKKKDDSGEQLSFEFMDRGAGDQDTRDLQPMRV